MNAVVRENPVIGISSFFAHERLSAAFQADRRVHVANLLPREMAERLARYLAEEMPYQTYLVAHEEEMATELGEELTPDDERELYDLACEGARNGFAAYFDTNHFPPRGVEADASRGDTPYEDCVRFLNSEPFLDLARTITGISSLASATIQASRFRAGQFVSFTNGTWSADTTGKRRLNFELNLTRQWRPEWGGMLEMRGADGHKIDATLPCFNSLDLFTFPRGYWISQVAPFAAASRYAIAGSLYVK